ncbi:MAG: 1-deoxy-D-xylulose-5-phosphate reductoisomerase [Deltaproteobacteria bacterium]|nr:MAG: 1-deoxy-D-xylulose-5-phosphate reductoisomerase [Deltaproteobacteria bacterium]
MKRIAILGSTGSIGVNTLKLVERFAGRFLVSALAAGENVQLLKEQILKFKPRMVSVVDEGAARELREALPRSQVEIGYGGEGVRAVATLPETELVVSAIVGTAGLVPTVAAIEAGKNIALANKETLVAAGSLVLATAKRSGVRIVPIDSEHSAIFQALQGHRREDIHRIILTASGGPFLDRPREHLEEVTPREALDHPNWRMGEKISIDSATLMNKGLEVIEARWLFDLLPDKIKVVIHPQSIIHSMVEYVDGSVVAQLSVPDMQGPIAYGLAYPERLEAVLPSLDFCEIKELTFLPTDEQRFPSLGLAYRALENGGAMPAVLNAANEIAVGAFLKERIKFTDIPRATEKTMDMYQRQTAGSLSDILELDRWARMKAEELIERGLT